MKKILVSLIMLCTAVSAWSQTTYTTKTINLKCQDGADADGFWKTTDSQTGIYVTAPKADNIACWQVDKYNALQLVVPDGYVITGVKFNYLNNSYLEAQGISGSSITDCDNLALNDESNIWEQKSGAFSRITSIRFRTTATAEKAYVTSVTVTYHKHTFTHDEKVAATCVATGTKESWTCSDCERTYYDEKGAREVAKAEDLVLSIDPTNHPEALVEHARVEATCIKDGNVQYWHCDHCNKNFEDAEGKGNEIVNVVIPKEQGSHNHLTSVAQKDATCTESGYTKNHWHCSDCGKNFEDEACTKEITDEVVIPAINHKNKTFTDYVAPTTTTEGNVAYWYCPDCDKHFEDAACTNELTEWQLEKLVNMMHLYFDGTSVPVETEHYMNTAKFNFTDDGDVILTVNEKSVTYDKEMIEKVKFSNGTPTVTISANEDPDNKGTYYSTFYSSLESYAVPEGFTAYRGEISDDGEKLNLASVKVMSRGKGYILKGSANSGSMDSTSSPTMDSTSSPTMEVTENADGDGSDNVLLGTDVTKELEANDYALSLGQYGVGFYLWKGKDIGANKAYLTLPSGAKALVFDFDEGTTTGIKNHQPSTLNPQPSLYNLNGIRVGNNYKGIVIKNGKKIYQR